MTASAMPNPMPMTIAPTVPSRVPSISPLSTGDWIIACHTKDQLKASLVSSRRTSRKTSARITAIVTQRHGCRTGTASMVPGRSACAPEGGVGPVASGAGAELMWTPSVARDQTAGLTVKSWIAPWSTPQSLSTFAYVPSVSSDFRPATIALARSVSALGTT